MLIRGIHNKEKDIETKKAENKQIFILSNVFILMINDAANP